MTYGVFFSSGINTLKYMPYYLPFTIGSFRQDTTWVPYIQYCKANIFFIELVYTYVSIVLSFLNIETAQKVEKLTHFYTL